MGKKMISIASGFQYSVNIGFDLSNDDKLKNFIPTKSAMQLMKEILLSTRENANERARILIGAYGKGKSHIVLAILSLLMGRDRSLFQKLLPRLDEEPGLRELVDEYAESGMKILPVVITGSSTSLTQAFLLALQRTLSQNGMQDVMPDTNYKAAIKTIDRWKLEYPETYEKLKDQLNIPIDAFISKLEDYDSSAYAEFESIYPILTSGSLFNPFIGFDVVELYESAAKVLKAKGYSGIYVIYDEFSKYLEANITHASVSDTKMLQDFAEKCNRSGSTQMHLIENKYLIYLKRSNGYLQLKQSSGVDIWQQIKETIEGKASSIAVKDVLNSINFDNYLYPSKYNDEHAMTRYFPFVFIDAQEVMEDIDWEKKSESICGDGIVYAVVPESEELLQQAKDILDRVTGYQRIMFVLPSSYQEIRDIVKEFYAVSLLKDETAGDEILFDEYEVIYEDLYEVISDYIRSYTRPETGKALFIHEGNQLKLYRKASLSEKLSAICDEIYSKTPVINNEVINKDEITSMATNSRSKIIAALLRNELEPNLGLVGTGQEVSIMRSTLVMPKILVENNGYLSIDLEPKDEYCKMDYVLGVIKHFVDQSAGGTPLSVLYDRLIKPEYQIGLRKGLIPIYIAAVLHEYKQRVVLKEYDEQIPLNADALVQINADPTGYSIALVDWSPDKEAFVDSLGNIFQEYVIDAEKATNVYDYVIYAMRRWYLSLPKYSREAHVQPDGKKMKKSYLDLMKMLKGNEIGYEFLFKKLPKAFNHEETNLEDLEENVTAAKKRYDELLEDLETQLRNITRETYAIQQESEKKRGPSLRQIMVDWCNTLQPSTFAELFTDGTNKALELYKNVTTDESTFIRRLAKLTTGLRLEDWDDNTIIHFRESIEIYKATAEKYQEKAGKTVPGHTEHIEGYQITYKNEQGETITKHFSQVESSVRAKLLQNRVAQAINEFGQAVSDEEKRQVLMDILQTMF